MKTVLLIRTHHVVAITKGVRNGDAPLHINYPSLVIYTAGLR